MYLFFDTETNGLPKSWNAEVQNVDNWPRIIQLAFILTDENFEVIDEFCELIQPDGWFIPDEKFWIDNGYSTAINESKGLPMEICLKRFFQCMDQSQYIVAHNIAFDYPITGAECIRYGLKSKTRPQRICTMKSTTEFCALPRNKFPKLEELHHKCFGTSFDGAHDALNDVRAMIRCFKYLKQNNIVNFH